MKSIFSKMMFSAAFVVLVLTVTADRSDAVVVYPTADGYMRDNPLNGYIDSTVVYGLLAQYDPYYEDTWTHVTEGLEDRAFAEFDISGQIGTVSGELKLTEWSPSPYADETVNVYAYHGSNADGIMDNADWTAGSYIGQITTTGGIGTIHTMDVSSSLNLAIAAGADYLGFRIVDPSYSFIANHFSYFISSSQVGSLAFSTLVGVEDQPQLNIVPEPATMLLLGLGGLVLRRKR